MLYLDQLDQTFNGLHSTIFLESVCEHPESVLNINGEQVVHVVLKQYQIQSLNQLNINSAKTYSTLYTKNCRV